MAALLSLLPFKLRRCLITGLMLAESRIGPPEDALKRLFVLWDDLDLLINERATAYGDGLNPKHRLTDYHDFFIANIEAGSRVLDVGCGVGAVARSIALGVKGVSVTGVDSNPGLLEKARAGETLSNLAFIEGDATRDLPQEHWDVIILSNVLEHIEDRVAILRALIVRNTPQRILIRLPAFERHWHMPLRRELGVNYFSDPTHHIEHTLGEFESEMTEAGLAIVECRTVWGEIWAHCKPL